MKHPQKEENYTINQEALTKYESNLEKMIQCCKEYKIPVVFIEPILDTDLLWERIQLLDIIVPKDTYIKILLTYSKHMNSVADNYKVPVIPHSLDLRYAHQPQSLFLDMWHPTAKGYSIIAKDIFNAINKLGILSNTYGVKQNNDVTLSKKE